MPHRCCCRFLDKYGTHIITSTYLGGEVTGSAFSASKAYHNIDDFKATVDLQLTAGLHPSSLKGGDHAAAQATQGRAEASAGKVVLERVTVSMQVYQHVCQRFLPTFCLLHPGRLSSSQGMGYADSGSAAFVLLQVAGGAADAVNGSPSHIQLAAWRQSLSDPTAPLVKLPDSLDLQPWTMYDVLYRAACVTPSRVSCTRTACSVPWQQAGEGFQGWPHALS